MKTLWTNGAILTTPGEPVINEGFLLTEGAQIVALGPMDGRPPVTDARHIDLAGALLMPGLINGHNHGAMTAFRGLADDLTLADWLHRHIFPAEKAHINRELVYWCTRLAAAEMLLSGTTAVADAYFFSGEAARALADCGMRAVVGHGIVDFPAPSVPDPRDNIAAVSRFIEQWQGANPLITPAVFAHSPYTCGPATLVRAKQLADQHGIRFCTHIAESQDELASIIEPQADSPIRHLAALGLLDANTVLIHAIWLDDMDIEVLAQSGAGVISCPQSNAKLAAGIARVPELLARQIPIGLGTDGCASNNSLDMFREMAMLAKIHKLRQLEATCLPARVALQMATAGNARIYGLSEIGQLAVGAQADLIVIDRRAARLTPWYHQDALVYAASGADVQHVMIAGQLVVENRQIRSFDLTETIAWVRQLTAAIH